VYKRQNPNAGRGAKTEVYEENKQGAIIEDDYELEEIMDDEEENYQEAEPQENFTSSMNINMPQNPQDPMKGHPKEVRNVLNKKK
jgi:hypothetical protein